MNNQDQHTLCLYAEGKLNPSQAAQFEKKLRNDPDLLNQLANLKADMRAYEKSSLKAVPESLMKKAQAMHSSLPLNSMLIRFGTQSIQIIKENLEKLKPEPFVLAFRGEDDKHACRIPMDYGMIELYPASNNTYALKITTTQETKITIVRVQPERNRTLFATYVSPDKPFYSDQLIEGDYQICLNNQCFHLKANHE